MGRAERILVFAVFGVIALILGITAFLPEQAAGKDQKNKGEVVKGPAQGGTTGQNGTRSPAAGSGGMTPVERLLQADQEPPSVTPPSGSERSQEPRAADAGAGKLNEGVVPAGPAASAVRFGVQHPSNPNYLLVKVRPGDTFGQIVERECGSLQHYLEQAIALNEAVEPGNIRAGQELILPFVPEDQLPRRVVKTDAPLMQNNGAANNGAANNGAANNSAPNNGASATFGNVVPEQRPGVTEKDTGKDKKPVAKDAGAKDAGAKDRVNNGASLAANAQPTSYKVQKGDTLWALAEKKWGRGKAKSKVQEILALNTGTLKSETDLRAGQVIKLP